MSANFEFLASHDTLLADLGSLAERYFQGDPVTCLIKLRQFGEVVAQRSAAHAGLFASSEENQVDLLRRLRDRGLLTREVADLFHGLRKAGNQATHDLRGDHAEALHQLKMARLLAVWFHRSFKDGKFSPGPFLPPPDPDAESKALKDELARLRKEFEQRAQAAGAAQEELLRVSQDKAALDAFARELETKAADLAKQLEALQAKTAVAPPEAVQETVLAAFEAGQELDLDEAATRKIIDQQLREAGWEADSLLLRYFEGARPQKGKNLAIAEWPTDKGPADYVLFCGLQVVGVVEAKRKNKDVSSSVGQAERYSKAFKIRHDETLPGGPWQEFKVPFLFATNGRPYFEPIKEKSGIWFRDARRPTNLSRPLVAWYTPEGLLALLKQDEDKANESLKDEVTPFIERDYQWRAVQAVEAAIARGQRKILLALATGTGKTRLSIGLVYRLLKTGRFRRILFLVDREALGIQAQEAFDAAQVDGFQTFTKIFDMKELRDIVPEPGTRLQVATVQGLVKRILYAEDGKVPPVDQYDCIVVDECHRGYILDREMSETELGFRDLADYISTYKRVLDYFDAVKIGLTATPALHTSQIFGDPVFHYTYREAVLDGWLVDHEPPIQIVTNLGEDGITWAKGTQMTLFDPQNPSKRDLETLADEVTLDIDKFNRLVVTENFNRAVCAELANHIDPTSDGKTLIFCATNSHADMVVRILKEELQKKYGQVDNAAVMKIMGQGYSDKPRDLIRLFKNERNPNIVVTVDLLTTGIDVPEIVNLVFLRRVSSRILYAQMIGRATRRCEKIGKQFFRIYDAVDLYGALAASAGMQLVAANPSISFGQLLQELATLSDPEAREHVRDQLVAKLQRKRRLFDPDATERFQTLAGMGPQELIRKIRNENAGETAAWFVNRVALAEFLDKPVAGDNRQILSEHPDKVRRVERGYGSGKKPQEYLDDFRAFLQENAAKLPALLVVAQRPKELTRKQLKEVRYALDEAGFPITTLRSAWKDATNEEIAASIIGFIRRYMADDTLQPDEERVDRAMKKIGASRPWTTTQRQWLDRIARQLKQDTVLEPDSFNEGRFKDYGGFPYANKVFDGRLPEVLAEIQDTIWKRAS